MIYLIAKFALLFLAATILGLLLGYWWAKSRFVDVTESYHSLTSRSEEDRAAMERIWSKVNALNLNPLENRVNSIEGLIRSLPQPEKAIPVDLNPVHEHIHRLEQQVKSIPQPEKVDFLPLYQKIQMLEGKINSIPGPKSIDLAPLEHKLQALEGQVQSIPQPQKIDLSPFNHRLQSLESQLKSLPQPAKVDLNPLHQKLQSIEGRLSALPQPAKVDLNPLHQKLHSLEGRLSSIPQPAKVDLNPVHQRLQSLENQLKSIPHPEKVDLAPLHGKLQLLASEIKSSSPVEQKPTNIEPLRERMIRIEQAIQALKGAESVNLNPIELRLQAIENKLSTFSTKSASTKASGSEGPRLLRSASMGRKDDLKQISGVGPKLERLLNQIGVYYFWQVASWNYSDVQAVDDMLDVFKGRIERDNWVAQANKLKLTPGAAKEPAYQPEAEEKDTAQNGLAELFRK